MSEWRNIILEKLKYLTNDKVVVIDYEGLLSDDELLLSLKETGFIYILIDPNTDFLDVRYQYEFLFRDGNGVGNSKRLLVILQDKEKNKASIPYDIAYDATEVNIDFNDLFPSIDATIIRQLEHSQYDALYKGIKHEMLSKSISLTRQQSLIFVLRNIYRIHLLEIENDVDFAAMLFNIYYTRQNIPDEIAEQMALFFEREKILHEWDVKGLITSSSSFWNYIQQIWDMLIGYNFYYFPDGPASLDILNPRLSIYLDNAFSDGYLRARKIRKEDRAKIAKTVPESLILAGTIQENENPAEELRRKKTILENRIDEYNFSDKSSYLDWLNFAPIYSQWLNIIEKTGETSEATKKKKKEINGLFTKWLVSHFDSMCYETSTYPLMVFRILPFLCKQARLDKGSNVALIVMDGMSYSDWITIKGCLSQDDSFSFEEHSCFAWIPTLTSVSRQAIFSGKLPRDYEKSIFTTDSESKEWKEYWFSEFPNLRSDRVSYVKTFEKADMDALEASLGNVRAIGIIINAVDDLLHSSHVLGYPGLHSNLNLWVKTSLLESVLKMLLSNSYNVFITSDHGNTGATGIGRINEGKLATEKGQRARIYESITLRDFAAAHNGDSIIWNSATLPSSYHPLLAWYGAAFTTQGNEEITHGGVSIEEVIVPFIEVKLNDR